MAVKVHHGSTQAHRPHVIGGAHGKGGEVLAGGAGAAQPGVVLLMPAEDRALCADRNPIAVVEHPDAFEPRRLGHGHRGPTFARPLAVDHPMRLGLCGLPRRIGRLGGGDAVNAHHKLRHRLQIPIAAVIATAQSVCTREEGEARVVDMDAVDRVLERRLLHPIAPVPTQDFAGAPDRPAQLCVDHPPRP